MKTSRLWMAMPDVGTREVLSSQCITASRIYRAREAALSSPLRVSGDVSPVASQYRCAASVAR
jgi:hypothetical protein